MISYKGKELWTYFFNKQKNHYNKYMFEMINYDQYLIFAENEIKELKGTWSKSSFLNSNPLFLEIGSGSGNFLIQLAQNNKEKNFIGDELRLKRLVYAARKAKNIDLKNIKFIRIDANKIEEFIDNNELSGVYINFPEKKKKNVKKRILSENLLNKLYPLLKKDGKIYFKTDHLDYYNSVLDLVNSRSDYKVLIYTDDLYSTEYIKNNIKTEFEHLFINKLKISIKYIEIVKCGD